VSIFFSAGELLDWQSSAADWVLAED
jgi:hypothetical protein